MNDPLTDKELEYVRGIIVIVAEAIQELGSVPSGHLYARLSGHLTLSQYQSIVTLLIDQKKITQKSHLLTWIGEPKK